MSKTGILAALLAKRGFTGAKDILDGENGFWRMVSSDRCDFERMTIGLGKEYEILKVGFKPYSCCRLFHPVIDAALELVRSYKINVNKVEEIVIETLSIITKGMYTILASLGPI